MTFQEIINNQTTKNKNVIILDIGSSKIRHGTNEQTKPTEIEIKKKFINKNGVIDNFETFEEEINTLMKNYKDKQRILINKKPFSSKKQTQKITEFITEKYNLKVDFLTEPVATLFGLGLSSGFILSMGESSTYTTPIIEGFIIDKSVQIGEVSGVDLTNHLHCLLKSENLQLEQVISLKEKYSFVSTNYDKEIKSKEEEEYELPDGKKINLTKTNLFECSEPLFQPYLVDKEGSGLKDLIENSLSINDSYSRNVLQKNVILTGGLGKITKIESRIEKEVKNYDLEFIKNGDKDINVWKGLSIYSNLRIF
jgi:actin-related protein